MYKKSIIFIFFIFFSFFQLKLNYDTNGNFLQGNIVTLKTTTIYAAGDITSENFSINVGDITPGGKNLKPEGKNLSQKVNFLLGTFIQKLMIALGSIALLIMTIGAGYMIFYHGQDELLSKGKSIFTSGLIALVVALSSYYIISLVRFILYST